MFEDMPVKTVFSLSADIPALEPEGESEGFAALKPGALVRGSFRELCFLRKLSGGGAILHVDSDMTAGQRLDLELGTGELLEGTVAWAKGGEVALAFDRPLDVFAIIAREIVSQPGERRRMPRVELRAPARLDAGGRSLRVVTRDVSQGGAKIEVAEALGEGEEVVLTLDGFRPVTGTVRWSARGVAGIGFAPEIAWEELMPWLRARRDMALRVRQGRSFLVPPEEGDAAPAAVPAAEGSVQLNLPARVREGTRRWNIEVAEISTRHVAFESFAAVRLGALLWIVLPGLEGWPARVIELDGYRFTCEFTQPLHPAVLERVLAAARATGA
jgi:hypothetical protein